MTSRQDLKRHISMAIFGFGVCTGLYGCVRVAGGIFTIGINDCAAEILAILLCPTAFMLACIVALRERTRAGIWLVVLSVVWLYGMLDERHYMVYVRGFPPRTAMELLESLLPSFVFLFFGVFALSTEYAGWPQVLKRKGSSSD